MRTYARTVPAYPGGPRTWVLVETDPAGFNDMVYLVTLEQVLLLNLGESPFYANYGIPAQQSIAQQIFPDLYVAATQQQFAGYFPSLLVARTATTPNPIYTYSVVTHAGATISKSVPQ
jgi:hypothetical protein